MTNNKVTGGKENAQYINASSSQIAQKTQEKIHRKWLV